jgi:flavin reductase (DIM6/NTAB) family NADH-FMN oxidoreductase RutF
VTPTPDAFREAVSRFATGITVVSCVVDGTDHAMTANAFASVSLDPLLVLVCVERESRFGTAVTDTDLWGVSFLPADAEATSRWFATKGRPLLGQLDRTPHHRSPGGVAWFDRSLAALECRTTDIHPAGDHDVVIGQVTHLEIPEKVDPEPLLYYRRRYCSVGVKAEA